MERVRIVAIDGRSGSGKTSLADLLRHELTQGHDEPAVLHLEDLYAGWDGLTSGIQRAEELILRWQAEAPVSFQVWDWHRGRWGAAEILPASTRLIVEGVGAIQAAQTAAEDAALSMWCEASDELRYQRVAARDGSESLEHWQQWARQEERYLTEYEPQERADVCLGEQCTLDHAREVAREVLADLLGPWPLGETQTRP